MAFVESLRGAYTHPAKQAIRPTDGVRGLFVRAPIRRGGLMLSVPLRYCYFPHGFQPPGRAITEARTDPSSAHALYLRRCNRGKELLPEFRLWAERLSPDAPSARVSLFSCASRGDDGDGVSCVALSSIEAALAVCVALRYFFGPALGLPRGTSLRIRRETLRLLPEASSIAQDALAERFVASLPMGLYLSHGVESLFTSDGEGAAEHACLEQLSYNLRDACLTHASTEQYRFMDENPSVLDNVLLTALYVVRARTLSVPLLSSVGAEHDRQVQVFAPGLGSLNHARAPWATAAAAVSPAHGAIVVRATRDVRRGEEVTLDYNAHGNSLATRYMLGPCQSRLGSLLDDDGSTIL